MISGISKIPIEECIYSIKHTIREIIHLTGNVGTERKKCEFTVEDSYLWKPRSFFIGRRKKLRYTNENNLKVSRLRSYECDILEKCITGTENPRQ